MVIRQLDELLIAAEPERWAALGLAVGADGVAQVGTIRLRLGAPGEPGIAGWRVRGLADGDLDGLPTQGSAAPPRAPAPAADHPLGALAIDHVVVATPDLERTIAALERAGLELRRVREAGPTARQGFFVVGDAVLEVVGPNEPDGQGPASFWGLVLVVEDLDAAAERLGPLLGAPRDAVQPGRRIATVRREAGLGTAVALITPR
ncbi:MAG: VOC family protein [Actinobacteria bacterium]|nr:MAG: VOC family protein [Actinomycetota bacterium]